MAFWFLACKILTSIIRHLYLGTISFKYIFTACKKLQEGAIKIYFETLKVSIFKRFFYYIHL